MDKYTEIRPIALGLAIKNNKLLVEEKFDKIKNQTFYRCLGGGIEFLEKSSDALKREFKEEVNIDITVNDYKDEYKITDRCGEFSAKWIDIDDFKNKSKILYPEDVFKYL